MECKEGREKLRKELFSLIENYQHYPRVPIAKWDGGDDSGHVTCVLDVASDELDDSLCTMVNNLLGFGSWAGEFSSSGMVYLIPETKSVEFDGSTTYRYQGETEVICDKQVLLSGSAAKVIRGVNAPPWINAYELDLERYCEDRTTGKREHSFFDDAVTMELVDGPVSVEVSETISQLRSVIDSAMADAIDLIDTREEEDLLSPVNHLQLQVDVSDQAIEVELTATWYSTEDVDHLYTIDDLYGPEDEDDGYAD